jgi:uncharacterized alpha-E superfamily protein
VKERAALIWGMADRSMLRDEAKCFLDAGGMIEISDIVLRMLRIAMPPGGSASADAYALILLQAVGGFHAYLRAVTAPPNAHPVARFLLFERAYPIAWLHAWTPFTRCSRRRTQRRATPSRCCA